MISVLLPTTGRPEMAANCVQGLVDTTEGHSLELCLAVDRDLDTVKRIKRVNLPDRVKKRLDLSNAYRGCSKAWNAALALSHGDPVVFAADDLEWGQGWLDAALQRLSEFPDGWGLVGFNDGHWNEELSTHYLMSRRFIKQVLGGVIAWPFYQHSFNDLEVNERARRANRYAWCEEAHVYHNHWLFGDREQDETDMRTLSRHSESERTFKQRKAAGFPNSYRSIL